MSCEDEKVILGIAREGSGKDNYSDGFFQHSGRTLCFCNTVPAKKVIKAVSKKKCTTVSAVGDETTAGNGCGSCRNSIGLIIKKIHGKWPYDL